MLWTDFARVVSHLFYILIGLVMVAINLCFHRWQKRLTKKWRKMRRFILSQEHTASQLQSYLHSPYWQDDSEMVFLTGMESPYAVAAESEVEN